MIPCRLRNLRTTHSMRKIDVVVHCRSKEDGWTSQEGQKGKREDDKEDRKRWKDHVDSTQSNKQVCVTGTDAIPKPFAIKRGMRMHDARVTQFRMLVFAANQKRKRCHTHDKQNSCLRAWPWHTQSWSDCHPQIEMTHLDCWKMK